MLALATPVWISTSRKVIWKAFYLNFIEIVLIVSCFNGVLCWKVTTSNIKLDSYLVALTILAKRCCLIYSMNEP